MEELNGVINPLNGENPESLKREGKDFNFVEIYPQLNEIIKNTQRLAEAPRFWELLPPNKRTNSLNDLRQIQDAVTRIKAFDSAVPGNPQGEKDAIINQVNNHYGSLYDNLFIPLETYLAKNDSSKDSIKQLVEEAKAGAKAIKDKEKQADDILKSVKETSAATGVSKFSNIFGTEAGDHKKAARNWLIANVVLVLVIAIFLGWMIDQLDAVIRGNLTPQETVQIIFGKLIIVSFLGAFLYQVNRNYRAHRHLCTVNRHRENSLKTFESFVKSTDDPKVKDVILMQATKTIFSIGETGYVSSKGDSSSPETINIFDHIK